MLYRFLRVLARVIFPVVFRLEAIGADNVPKRGPVVLCANHISYWDPPILGTPLDRKVHFMAKEELFHIPGFGWLITKLGAFPVKRGGVSKESIRRAIELLREGNVLGIFPEGTRKAGADAIGKRGTATLALKSGAVVVPVAIIGTFAPFRRVKVVYGEPLDLAPLAEAHPHDAAERATERIMDAIRELKARHQLENS